MTSSSITRTKLSTAAGSSYDDWYETESLVIGRGKQLDEIAANDEITRLVNVFSSVVFIFAKRPNSLLLCS